MKLGSFILALLLPAFIYAGPVVTSVSPTNGPADGGNTVRINGSDFTGATAVNFGTVPADTFTVESDNSINVTAPATFAAATIDITVTTGSGTSPTSSADQYTYVDGNWYAYVLMQNTPDFQFVNLATATAGTALTLANGGIASSVTPDGQLALCTIRPDLGAVNLALQQALPIIPVNLVETNIAISPDGRTAYIVVANPAGLQTFDIASQTLGAFIPLSHTPADVAITPDGLYAYVMTSGGVYPINLSMRMVGSPISVPAGFSIAITPDGTKAFATSSSGNNASWIDLTTSAGFNNINLGGPSVFVAIAPNGKTAYFIKQERGNNLVSVDVATLTVGTAIHLQNISDSIAITPDSKTAFVPWDTNHILPIDLTTHTKGTPIEIANVANFITVSPDQAPIAAFTFESNQPGMPTAFDASASVSPVGTIFNYTWDFGDGATIETSSSSVTHIYAFSENYLVTLTVTNSAGTSTTQTYTGHMASNNGGPSAQTSQSVRIVPLLPPANVHGFQMHKNFLLQKKFRNVIEWTPPSKSLPPVAYNIYSDSALTDLIESIPADGRLKFVEDQVKEHPYTYYIVSVDAQGDQSLPITVLIVPKGER